jgi:hypothetical protein
LDTRMHCWKLQPRHESGKWDLVFYCDSDLAGDPASRISVTGFIMHLLGVPICWRSKAQKGVTLSNREDEYAAMSEAVKEIRFIYYLLRSVFIEVKLPNIVRCDNVGAIFMAENSSSGVCIQHVDTMWNTLLMISPKLF